MSEEGRGLLSIDGYTFSAHKVYGLKTRWVCSTHNGKGCKAMVDTEGGEIVNIRNKHSHDK